MPYLYYGYGYGYGSGATGICTVILLVTFALSLWAQFKVQSTFKKYSRVTSARGMTGAQAARMILDRNGLQNVSVEHISGSLSDHFDPRTNVIRLSDSVYDNASVAAIGVAAHECGHAVQYATGYGPITLRARIIPVTNFGSRLAWPLLLIGLLLSAPTLAYLGVAFFALSTLFQLVTLPVEFNASARALATLEDYGTLGDEELTGAKKVLSAAAMTYVAALAMSIANLLRLLAIASSSSRRR